LGDAVSDAEMALTVLESVESPRIRLVALRLGLLPILSELNDFERFERALASARAISDSLETDYLRPGLIACQAWMDLRAGRSHEAKQGFSDASSSCGNVLLECLWSLRFELLAWEEAGSPRGVASAASRLIERARDESPPFLAWGEYGTSLAALLDEDWPTALDCAETAHRSASLIGEIPLVWRTRSIAAKSLLAMGRGEEAKRLWDDAQRAVGDMANSLVNPRSRSMFLSRNDIGDLRTPLSEMRSPLSFTDQKPFQPQGGQ
jgi:hypothetical protein